MEKLGIFERRKHINKLTHVLPLSEPISDERPLLGETSNALLDLGLHTMELGLQFSHVFHLAHPRRDGLWTTCGAGASGGASRSPQVLAGEPLLEERGLASRGLDSSA